MICTINITELSLVQSNNEEKYSIYPIEADQIHDAINRLDSMNPDCILIRTDDPETKFLMDDLARLREYCDMRYIPFVAIADSMDTQLHTLCVDAMVPVSIDGETLVSVIRKLVGRRMRILDQIWVDLLTGANNYRYLLRELARQLHDMKRSHETFSVVYIEVDKDGIENRKQVLAITKSLVDFILESIRPTDSLSHLSNEGFALILPKTVKDDAMKLAERLLTTFSGIAIETPEGKMNATFSCKVMEFVDSNQPVEEIMEMLPFSEEDGPTLRKGIVLDGTPRGSDNVVRKLKLAIIDDDRLIREMLKHQLTDIGEALYDVEIKTFADGEEFFNDPWHRQDERFLLLIDRVLPKMDGLEILHRIRTSYDRRRYLCFMVSSKGAETDITLAIQRGANDYMVKPFNLKELRARIKRLIGGLR